MAIESLDQLVIKRIYEPASSEDGTRVLVDRLWPRGVAKEHAQLDWWAKEIAPSNELRKSFGHNPADFEKFCAAYQAELEQNAATDEFLDYVKNRLQEGKVTLLYGAKDKEHNNAVALHDFLCAHFEHINH